MKKLFTPEDFILEPIRGQPNPPHLHPYFYSVLADQANAKLEREGKVYYSAFEDLRIPCHPSDAKYRALLVNIEPISEPCKHPSEKVTNILTIDKGVVTTKGWTCGDCNKPVVATAFEVVDE